VRVTIPALLQDAAERGAEDFAWEVSAGLKNETHSVSD